MNGAIKFAYIDMFRDKAKLDMKQKLMIRENSGYMRRVYISMPSKIYPEFDLFLKYGIL